jgi:hypothetical protein
MNGTEKLWANFDKIPYWEEVIQFVCTFQFGLKSGEKNKEAL